MNLITSHVLSKPDLEGFFFLVFFHSSRMLKEYQSSMDALAVCVVNQGIISPWGVHFARLVSLVSEWRMVFLDRMVGV